MKSNSKIISALSTLTLATLTACGGGGGGATPTASSGPVTNQPAFVLDTTIVTSVPAAAYSTGTEEKAAYNLLNSERGACGFGLLAQNTQLDAAARLHNDYQIINNTASHNQNQTQFPTGFTGARAFDRVTAAGYLDAAEVADEFTFKSGTTSKTGIGEGGMRNLLSGPYHLAGMVDGYRDVGISVRSSAETTPTGVNNRVILHVNAAHKTAAAKQLIPTGEVRTYPCAGSVGVNRQLTNETPNPVPGRDLAVNPIGTPIYVSTRVGDVLTIASASMKATGSTTSIVLRQVVSENNDPNAKYRSHEAYFAPDAPLAPVTDYTVTVTGSANGVAFPPVSFKYTTGN